MLVQSHPVACVDNCMALPCTLSVSRLIKDSMREFCQPDMPVFMVDKGGDYAVMTQEHLLPMSFGPESMRNSEL